MPTSHHCQQVLNESMMKRLICGVEKPAVALTRTQRQSRDGRRDGWEPQVGRGKANKLSDARRLCKNYTFILRCQTTTSSSPPSPDAETLTLGSDDPSSRDSYSRIDFSSIKSDISFPSCHPSCARRMGRATDCSPAHSRIKDMRFYFPSGIYISLLARLARARTRTTFAG